MLIPCAFIAAKSRSQAWGLGSNRNLRCTSEAMYVVPTMGSTRPSARSQSRETESRGPCASSAASFTQKPVSVVRGDHATPGTSTRRVVEARSESRARRER